ncbi:MAG: RNA polymerase subunit sigma [Gammaproteobacteria bacterium]|nr:RNA polymerase subunit sigma [Gammaproteobacteria bacterium]
MSATLKTGESRHDGATRTLGTLLYCDRAGRAREAEWLALVASVAAGDQSALRALYDRTHRIVFTLIMRIVANRESTEELTADVYHEVWRRASKYDAAAGSVVGWIMNLARSRAIDRMRFDHRKMRVNPHPEAPSEALGDPCSEAVEFEQTGQAVREDLLVLTPEDREVI